MRFSLARNLGLDPRTLLLQGAPPRFVWREQARFKHLRSETGAERDAIASFGRALGALLIAGTSAPPRDRPAAGDLRQTILRTGKPYVSLQDLVVLCWSLGIPAVHLRVFPLRQKRMAAMSVRVHDRFAVLLGKDSKYEAELAFFLAHELGHIWLGHLRDEAAVVDFEQETLSLTADDSEEQVADAFALELLTGEPQLTVLPQDPRYVARSLASVAMRSADQLQIDPGVLVMCFGYSTKDWTRAYAALRSIYKGGGAAWTLVNRIAWSELAKADIPSDGRDYLQTVLGFSEQ